MDYAILFIILIIVLILVVLVVTALLQRPHTGGGNTGATAAYSSSTTPIYEVDYWSGATGITGPLGVCNIYYFQGEVDSNVVSPYPINNLVPPQLSGCFPVSDIGPNIPSFNLNNPVGTACFGPQPVVSTTKCVDPDQLAVQVVQRTCTGTTGTNGLGCVDSSGSHFAPGGVDTFLEFCNLKPCTDTLASIVLNYNLSTDLASTFQNMYCLEPDATIGITGPSGATGVVSVIMYVNKCNYSINQQWKIDRANLNSSATGFVANNVGTYAQIKNRQTGLCLAQGGTGTNIFPTLSSCVANSYPWALTNGFKVGVLTTPPQISWVGNRIVPLNTTSELLEWLDSSNPYSLVVAGIAGTSGNTGAPAGYADMAPFALTQVPNGFYRYNANYLDYAIFNFIIMNQNDYPLVTGGT